MHWGDLPTANLTANYCRAAEISHLRSQDLTVHSRLHRVPSIGLQRAGHGRRSLRLDYRDSAGR